MPVLRLFHRSNPFRQIEARALDEGELAVGRDPGADGWRIDDPERELSRLHCVLEHRDGRLTVRDASVNGLFVGQRRVRPAAGEPHPLEPGETLRLGRFLIVVDGPRAAETPRMEAPAPAAYDDPLSHPLLRPLEVPKAALEVPSEWAEPVEAAAPRPASRPAADGALLEAFCAGARLDASAFAGEDPAEVMRRLGALYQQMVLGLSDLMNERSSVKAEYQLERTAVRAEGNNPFRWAAAQRVAVDLLKPRDDGFLSGPAAVKASFEDLKKHLACMLAGLRAALASTLDTLAPETIEGQLGGRSFLRNRGGAAWTEYGRLYAEFRRRAGDDPDNAINREFRAGYGRRLKELQAMDPHA